MRRDLPAEFLPLDGNAIEIHAGQCLATLDLIRLISELGRFGACVSVHLAHDAPVYATGLAMADAVHSLARPMPDGRRPDCRIAAPATAEMTASLAARGGDGVPMVIAPFEPVPVGAGTTAAPTCSETRLPTRPLGSPLLPVAELVDAVLHLLTPQCLRGARILVTAGPTVEDLDAVRFISNRSSGRMGVALAAAAACMGASVKLVHGPLTTGLPVSAGVEAIPVRSAQEMHDAVMSAAPWCTAAVMAAAVADFTPAERLPGKLKKGPDDLILLLTRTRDILADLGAMPDHPVLVGFAAETEHVATYAQAKLRSKNCDAICANDVSAPGSGFACDTNRVTVYRRDTAPVELPFGPKEQVARDILLALRDLLTPRNTPQE